MRRVLLLTLACVLWTAGAHAKDTIEAGGDSKNGPRLNPFECYGRYESAAGNRRASQIRIEIKKKFDQIDEKDPNTVAAMKACVIGRLKGRVGDSDASEWLKKAISLDPEEPGYELFLGMYYSMSRGANGPVLEEAELHLHRALSKIKALEESGQIREYHEIVRAFTQKRLEVLYQQDGQAILPFKAAPNGDSTYVPQLSVFGEARASGDTRDFWYNNEMRVFTGEKQFAESPIRANADLTERQKYDLARAPLRTKFAGGVRLRQNPIGAFDAAFSEERAYDAQIVSFYKPTDEFSDVKVQQLRLGFERVLPLYPLLDLRIKGDYLYTQRQGVREFEPEVIENFHGFQAKPAISRFIGPDKLTLEGTVAYFNLEDYPGGVPDQALREKLIRSAQVTYSIYRPLRLYEFSRGRPIPYRTPTRGLSFYAGAAQDFETYGTRRVRTEDFYGGVRFGTPIDWELNLQGGYLKSLTSYIDQNDPAAPEYVDKSQDFSGMRLAGTITYRLVDQEARPLFNDSILDLDMVNLVMPLQWDKAFVSSSTAADGSIQELGDNTYENIRVGGQIWAKAFGAKTWGTPLLFTTGYDFQYFYNINKTMHLWQAAIRLGWGDL